MGKIVYSIVLSEEVVAAIDILATRGGQSRSGLINQVLAGHAGLTTPEEHGRQIGAALQTAAEAQGLRAALSPSGALTLHTALRYKYNPTLRYVVELRHSGPTLAEVRVQLRSQSEALLSYLSLFFELWDRLEQRHLPRPPAEGEYHQAAGRYRRLLRRPAEAAGQEALGREIAAWVAMLDSSLKAYFASLQDAPRAVRDTETAYREGLAGLTLGRFF